MLNFKRICCIHAMVGHLVLLQVVVYEHFGRNDFKRQCKSSPKRLVGATGDVSC